MTVLEKRAMVDPSHPKISICRQCELLDMGRESAGATDTPWSGAGNWVSPYCGEMDVP